jgi:SAM-dependent methyltransferase
VLWDSGADAERRQYLPVLRAHLDASLPVIDIGCGNGTFTRWLAGLFPQAVGIDVSAQAILRAGHENAGKTARFLEFDAAAPGAGKELQALAGEANAFVRGVLHVLAPRDRAQLAANLHTLVGTRGRVFLTETNFRGGPLRYVQHLGATAGQIPAPLRRAIQTLPMPGHFGPAERSTAFPTGSWDLVTDGTAWIHTVAMADGQTKKIPAYYAVLQAR